MRLRLLPLFLVLGLLAGLPYRPVEAKRERKPPAGAAKGAKQPEKRKKREARDAVRKGPKGRKERKGWKEAAARPGPAKRETAAERRKRLQAQRGPRKPVTRPQVAQPKPVLPRVPAPPPAVVAPPAVKPAPEAGDALARADRAYGQKSYARALNAYREAVRTRLVPAARRAEVDHRIVRCLGAIESWDAALVEGERVAARHAGTVWEARTRAWLMGAYLRAPHAAWKVGPRTYRTGSPPEVQEAERPERVDLTDEDARAAVRSGEQALALFLKLGGATANREAADTTADLARVTSALQLAAWAEPRNWPNPGQPVWKLDPAAPYDPSWPVPRRVLQLYLLAERVGAPTQQPLARLAQALWLRGYHHLMASVALKPDGKTRIPYPYEDRGAIAVLRTLVLDFPRHPEADHASVLIGDWLKQDGKSVEALALYRAFVAERPKSPWAEHARSGIDGITRVRFAVFPPMPQAPGARAKLSVEARNVKTASFTAHRVRLEELLRAFPPRPKEDVSFESIAARAGGAKGLARYHQGATVAWKTAVATAEDYQFVSKELETPLTQNGAYVVEAEAGPVRTTFLLLISDLAAIEIHEARAVHVLALNSATGAPVSAASVWIAGLPAAAKAAAPEPALRTDAEGLVKRPFTLKGGAERTIQSLVWKGDRYAVTGSRWLWGVETTPPSTRVYAYTERPVYRPGQAVHFRALLLDEDERRTWKPVRSQKVRVTVLDPHRAEVFRQDFTSNEFGSVNGSIPLSSAPALGEYAIRVEWPGHRGGDFGGDGGFRVEEYKKPEFDVRVEPWRPRGLAAAPFRIGDPASAKIVARYYFGAPVAKAKVRYSITRSAWTPASPFRRPYHFLYLADRSEPEADENGEQEKLDRMLPNLHLDTQQGVATTNALGEVVIPLDTKIADPRFRNRHLTFLIQAEVIDASRRTITGSGEVRVLGTQFNTFLDLRRGFTSVGDQLQADLRTLDGNGAPVSAAGTARIFRLTATEDGKWQREEVFSQPVRTDPEGRGLIAWTATRDGHYEVRFEARDAWEQLVTARLRTWVAGEGAGAGVFHNRHVMLVAERNTYRIGQTARVLAVADEPGLTVLLTQEAGDRLLERKVVRLEGRSQVLEVPLSYAQSPDVTLAVTGVRDREYFRATAQLFVPPAEQLLTYEVTADRAAYKPGERARFRVRARDVDGRPVRTEASVGIVDASLFYIQGETVESISSLYARERGSNVDPTQSMDLAFETVAQDAQPPSKFEFRSWRFPEGLGRLPHPWDRRGPMAGFFYWDLMQYDLGALMRLGAFQGVPGYVPLARARLRAPAEVDFGSLYHGGAGGTAMGLDMAPAIVASPEPKAAPRSVEPWISNTGFRGYSQPVQVRTTFADSAFWTPAVVTGPDGEATVELTWPDNLTRWRATARGWTDTAQVGEASTEVETKKELLVRLQAPRFFVERDEATLSANVHNYTNGPRRVRVALRLEGDCLVPSSGSTAADGPPQPRPLFVPRADRPSAPRPEPLTASAAGSLERWVELPAGGETRVEWTVRVAKPGEAQVEVRAESDSEGDAVRQSFPVLVHGVEKLIVRSGAMTGGPNEKPGLRTGKLVLDLPAQRAPGSGDLTVQLSPSVAAAMLDALPYVVDYPYGCTEQTLSRWLPSVVAAKTLTDLGIDLGRLKARADREAARLQAAAPKDRPGNSAYTYAAGEPGTRDPARMAREMWLWRSEKSPVFNPDVLKKMVAAGLDRLRRFQHGDGGWGWWEHDSGDLRLTAYVVQGLVTARRAGTAVPAAMIERGMTYLAKGFTPDLSLEDQVLAGGVLALDPKRDGAAGGALLDRVYPKRDRLTPYGLALLALALQAVGHPAEARICLDNLENTAQIDPAAGTCSWTRDRGDFWDWYNNDVETAATCLRAYLAVRSADPRVPMVVKWLVNNRRGGAWESTRETALAVEALAEYVRLNRELAPESTVTVDVGGRVKRSYTLTAENALLFDERLTVPAALLGSGPQTVTVTRSGRGSLYYTAYLRYFTVEEGIRPAGHEIQVRRRYFRVPSGPGAADATRARTLVRDGDRLESGDTLEVELLIESKNRYEYLVFEDMKPAGCEPVDLQSGTRYGDGLCSNMELRDEKVAFFITHLPQGRRLITYRLRAEVPGAFHALPVNGYAMYAPEVRCLSAESVVGIVDSSPTERP